MTDAELDALYADDDDADGNIDDMLADLDNVDAATMASTLLPTDDDDDNDDDDDGSLAAEPPDKPTPTPAAPAPARRASTQVRTARTPAPTQDAA